MAQLPPWRRYQFPGRMAPRRLSIVRGPSIEVNLRMTICTSCTGDATDACSCSGRGGGGGGGGGGQGEEYFVLVPTGTTKEDLQQMIEDGMQVRNRNFAQSTELVSL